MDRAGPVGSAAEGQEGVEVAGEHHTADSLGQHQQKDRRHQRCLDDPVGVVFPPKQGPMPAAVEDMVQNKEQ